MDTFQLEEELEANTEVEEEMEMIVPRLDSRSIMYWYG